MLGDIIDMILIPVKNYLDMLLDERITSYLGVSVLGIAVTCMITLIVVAALVNRINAGAGAASIMNTQDTIRRREERQAARQERVSKE